MMINLSTMPLWQLLSLWYRRKKDNARAGACNLTFLRGTFATNVFLAGAVDGISMKQDTDKVACAVLSIPREGAIFS